MRKRNATGSAGQEFYWVIEGFDSAEKIYFEKIKSTLISTTRMETLLPVLTAKAGLTFEEIVGAYVTKRTKRHNSHLTIHQDAERRTLSCGSNPHFAARLVKA